jgi:hypothetical protein
MTNRIPSKIVFSMKKTVPSSKGGINRLSPHGVLAKDRHAKGTRHITLSYSDKPELIASACRRGLMTARFSRNQRNTPGHRPCLQSILTFLQHPQLRRGMAELRSSSKPCLHTGIRADAWNFRLPRRTSKWSQSFQTRGACHPVVITTFPRGCPSNRYLNASTTFSSG